MKETGGKKKRRGEEDYDGEDIDKYLGLKEGKSSKKFRRRWDHITANEWINDPLKTFDTVFLFLVLMLSRL